MASSNEPELGPDSRVRLLHVEGLDDESAKRRSPPSKEVRQVSPKPSSKEIGNDSPKHDLSRERLADATDQISACMKENVSIRGDIRSMRMTIQRNAQELMSALESEKIEREERLELLERRLPAVRSGDEPSAESVSAPLIVDLEERLQELQRLLEQEMAVRAAGDEQMARQISRITMRRSDDTNESESPACESQQTMEQSSGDWHDVLAKEREMWSGERALGQAQLKDLRLCLEAEVGARSAATERLAREVKELKTHIESPNSEKYISNDKPKDDSDKLKESLHSIAQALQSRMQLLEDKLQGLSLLHEDLASRQAWEEKVQMMLERSEQRKESHDLETDMLRDTLKSLEDQAKRHVMWAETQMEKHCAEVKDISQKVSHEARARSTLEEELRQLLVNELKTQAKFFETEIKTLLSSAHESWQGEMQKIWVALDPTAAATSRTSSTPKRNERYSEPVPVKTAVVPENRSSEPYLGKGSSGVKGASFRHPEHGHGTNTPALDSTQGKGGPLLTSRNTEPSPPNHLEGRPSDPPLGKGSSISLGATDRYSEPQAGKGQGSSVMNLGAKLSDPSSVCKSVNVERIPRQSSSSTSAATTGARSEPLPGRVSGAGLQRPQAEPKRQPYQTSGDNKNFTRIRLD